MYSIEKLVHFNCPFCSKWWSISDAPITTKSDWHCPWCGSKIVGGDLSSYPDNPPSEMLQNIHNFILGDPDLLASAAMSYRHDYGLLSEDEQTKLRREARDWFIAGLKAIGYYC